jgi:hypothetical protein
MVAINRHVNLEQLNLMVFILVSYLVVNQVLIKEPFRRRKETLPNIRKSNDKTEIKGKQVMELTNGIVSVYVVPAPQQTSNWLQ